MTRRPALTLTWTVALLTGLACGPKTETPAPASAAGKAPLAESLKVVCWDDYLTPAVVADFEKQFGVRLEVEFLNNNEEAIARLEKGEVWDVWAPSDYAVHAAKEKGLLAPLDLAAIPNQTQVGRRFRNASYDQEFRYSVPFYWGMSGWGYEVAAFPQKPDSWSWVFDESRRKRLAGKIRLLDDVRETMGIALIYLGLDPNSTDPQHLAAARDLLIAAKSGVTFDSDVYDEALATGEAQLAHGWTDVLSRLAAGDSRFAVTLPREGVMLWIDNWAIPAASKKRETAQVLINYLLNPAVAAKLATDNQSATTLPEVRPMLAPEVARNLVELPENIPFHVFRYLGEDGTARMEAAWEAVKAGR